MVLLGQLFAHRARAPALLLVRRRASRIYLVVSHIVPPLLMRSSPERALELLLPMFTAAANRAVAVHGADHRLGRRERIRGATRTRLTRRPTATASALAEPAPEIEQSRLLRSVVDFGETLVREVMTPRPDIVAIRSDATLDDLRKLVQEQEYSRLPVYTDNLDNIVGLIVVKDLIQMTETPLGIEAGLGHHAACRLRAGDQARGRLAAGIPGAAVPAGDRRR